MSEDWQTIKHDLIKPITINGAKVETLTLREPNAGALELIEQNTRDDGEKSITVAIAVAAALSGISMDDARKLSLKDIRAIGEKAAPFLEALAE